MTELRIVPAGDSAVVIELPSQIDPATNARAVALARILTGRCAAQVRDAVVGYSSVTLYFDPRVTRLDWLHAEIAAAGAALPQQLLLDARVVDVPVHYGGEHGPDLAAVAARADLTEAEIVALHAGVTYRVYLIGFLPGFAYMAHVDSRLALPRRTTPRERVPAGSVAIAAGQTGIYPMDCPGGWHVIGWTPVKPYDPARTEPFLFRAGDQVRFHAVEGPGLRMDG